MSLIDRNAGELLADGQREKKWAERRGVEPSCIHGLNARRLPAGSSGTFCYDISGRKSIDVVVVIFPELHVVILAEIGCCCRRCMRNKEKVPVTPIVQGVQIMQQRSARSPDKT
jgi:hypothetical protein